MSLFKKLGASAKAGVQTVETTSAALASALSAISGFAVVAVEVRRLAQSAASASADVKLLIEKSTIEVRGGSKLDGSKNLVNSRVS